MQIQVPPGSIIRIETPGGREPLTIAPPSPVRDKARSWLSSLVIPALVVCSLAAGYEAAREGLATAKPPSPPSGMLEKQPPAPLAPQPTNPFGLKP